MAVLELEYGTLKVEENLDNALMDERMGAGSCSVCNCTGYRDAGFGNENCMCAHTYAEHW